MQITFEESMERAKNILSSADRIVALLGVGVVMECGALNYLNNEVIYRIEDKYSRSPDEIMSTGFYSARTEKFFQYYKEEYLADKCKPNETFKALKLLDDQGRLAACITKNTHGLEKEIGIRFAMNVIVLFAREFVCMEK